MPETEWERRQREERKAKADERFQRSRRWLGRLRGYGQDVPAFKRALEAQWDIREHRQSHNLRGGDHEELHIALNVARETWAMEIQEACQGQPDLDPHTVAVIVAGLRCPARPYCTGCPSCQTVTAPTRPNKEHVSRW